MKIYKSVQLHQLKFMAIKSKITLILLSTNAVYAFEIVMIKKNSLPVNSFTITLLVIIAKLLLIYVVIKFKMPKTLKPTTVHWSLFL